MLDDKRISAVIGRMDPTLTPTFCLGTVNSAAKLTTRQKVHGRSTWSWDMLVTPSIRAESGMCRFLYSAVSGYNELPQTLRNRNHVGFKVTLNKHLLGETSCIHNSRAMGIHNSVQQCPIMWLVACVRECMCIVYVSRAWDMRLCQLSHYPNQKTSLCHALAVCLTGLNYVRLINSWLINSLKFTTV